MLKNFRHHMTTNKFKIGIVLLIAVVFPSCADAGIIKPVSKLLIDVDAGVDDADAIVMAIEAEKLDNGPKILGITCVNGNTDVDHVALNVLKTLKIVNKLDIPVYKGAGHPLVLPGRKDNHFGTDGFHDFDVPDTPSLDLIQSKHAVNAMIDLVKAHPGEVTLVALGPLTNVALAIRMYPTFLDELQQIIVMGGSTEGRASHRLGVEFNFGTDPVANYIVFNSSTSKPVTLMPWETTLKVKEFRSPWRQSEGSAAVRVINGTEGVTWPVRTMYNCADGSAMSIALTSGSIVTKSATYYSEAIYDGTIASGMIVVDYANVTRKASNTNLIQDIDLGVYKQLLGRYLTTTNSEMFPLRVY